MDELLLAEEQAVINRGVGILGEVEAAFQAGRETEGTLVLTTRRLIYAHGSEKEDDLPIGIRSEKRLIYSDVEHLESIPPDPSNLQIPLESITAVAGHHLAAVAPKLEVRWNEGGRKKVAEFVQQITGSSRRRNLNDWAGVIERLRKGEQKIVELPPLPDKDSLEGRVLSVLGDMQEKGMFTIEREVEEQFGVDLDPDAVEAACGSLVSQGFLKLVGAPGDEAFYQRVSALGEDDLSL